MRGFNLLSLGGASEKRKEHGSELDSIQNPTDAKDNTVSHSN